MDHPDKVSGCGVSSESGNFYIESGVQGCAVIAVSFFIIWNQNQANSS